MTKKVIQGITLLFALISVLTVITGCVSSKDLPEQSGGEVLYETDFSAEDGKYELHPGLELSGGTLKFTGENPHCRFSIPYGQDSITELRLFRSSVDTNAEIHLLHDHEKSSYIYYSFREDEVYLSMGLGGEKLLDRHADYPVRHGEWHDIRMELINGESTLYIDGNKVLSASIDPRLPEKGEFLPAAFNSMEIDDLRIVGLGPKESDIVELPAVEGKILYRTGFEQEDDMFDYHRGMHLQNGLLDFVEDNPGCNFKIPYGQDSITQFKLRLPEPDNSAHISLLWQPEDGMRMLYIIEAGHVWLDITAEGEEVWAGGNEIAIKPGAWYIVRIELREGTARLWIDGRKLIEAPISPKLPQKALFFPLAYESQMQMDDLIIAELPRAGAVATAQPKTEERSEVLKPLGKSDFGQRRIAVVGIKTDQSNLSAALASFVTNALVNMNIGRIVERSDVEEIISEYNFQASAITDESTAVEIGKLLGADIIAVGSLYQVGTIDYLNIKLIEVETGEIVASSMSSSTVEEEYLRMCNEAVEQIGR
jgi:Curli production assembly/transport component CsgG/Laminin G domain